MVRSRGGNDLGKRFFKFVTTFVHAKLPSGLLEPLRLIFLA